MCRDIFAVRRRLDYRVITVNRESEDDGRIMGITMYLGIVAFHVGLIGAKTA